MKTVCFYIADISRSGGTERSTSAIAEAIAAFSEKYEVILLSLSGNNIPFFPAKNVKYYSLFKKKYRFKLLFPFVILRLLYFLKREKVDVLIDVEVILSFYSFLPAKLLRIKHIVWEKFNYNANLGLKIRNYTRRLAMKYADKIVVLTKKDKECYEQNINDKSKIVQIYNPVRTIPEKTSDLSSKKIIAVGRLAYQKGYDFLLPAFKKVTDKYPEWKILIVGGGEDKEKLLKLSSELGLTDKVIFTGAVKNVESYYLESSIFVMSSRFEGFPNVLLEAISFGLPIVSFDCPCGPAEIIENGVNGFLIPAEDIIQLAAKMETLIDSSTLRHQMGQASVKLSEKFYLEKIVKKWLKIIEED